MFKKILIDISTPTNVYIYYQHVICSRFIVSYYKAVIKYDKAAACLGRSNAEMIVDREITNSRESYSEQTRALGE